MSGMLRALGEVLDTAAPAILVITVLWITFGLGFLVGRA